MDPRSVAVMLLGFTSLVVVPTEPLEEPTAPVVPVPEAAADPADVFQYPLPTWSPHCLGFGSQWRYCNGQALRACASGAVWLHTGADIATGIQPVVAAGDGVIAGYQIDPTFRGGVLIRHQMTKGVVMTQYWHVWLRPGFTAGSEVKRGQAFADVADMGSRSEERRVGKECRARWTPEQEEKKRNRSDQGNEERNRM